MRRLWNQCEINHHWWSLRKRRRQGEGHVFFCLFGCYLFWLAHHMDLFYLLHGFVKVVLCISRPLPIFPSSCHRLKKMASASIHMGTKVPSLCDLFSRQARLWLSVWLRRFGSRDMDTECQNNWLEATHTLKSLFYINQPWGIRRQPIFSQGFFNVLRLIIF